MNAPAAVYRIGVISDTHGYVSAAVHRVFEGVQMILHAGDIGNDAVLAELETIATVQAVSGNVDGPPMPGMRPLFRELTTPAGRIALTHGHDRTAPAIDKAKLCGRFKDFAPDIVVFGHTHIPFLERVGGVTLFNPGVAGRVRGKYPPSVGMITVEMEGQPPRLEHVVLETSMK